MPESKGRKPKPVANKSPSQRRQERMARLAGKQVLPSELVGTVTPEAPREVKPNRDPAREIPAGERFELPELPEPADYLQVLVALSKMDPLAQEVMIAERLGAMPSQRDGGMPVNIPRMVRPAWAHNLRKLGVFVVPELATHELVAPDGSGMLINHTAGTMRAIGPDDLWEKAKKMDPALGRLVDDADTPEEKREAMRKLASKLPVELRVAMDRLISTSAEELEPH